MRNVRSLKEFSSVFRRIDQDNKVRRVASRHSRQPEILAIIRVDGTEIVTSMTEYAFSNVGVSPAVCWTVNMAENAGGPPALQIRDAS